MDSNEGRHTLTAVFNILTLRTGPQQRNSRFTSLSEKPAGNGPASTTHISQRFSQTCRTNTLTKFWIKISLKHLTLAVVWREPSLFGSAAPAGENVSWDDLKRTRAAALRGKDTWFVSWRRPKPECKKEKEGTDSNTVKARMKCRRL